MADLFDNPGESGGKRVMLDRDRWGRPLVIPPGGGKPVGYTRCTTYVDVLEDKYNLGRWQQRMVALGMANRPDLVLAAAATDRDDKYGLDQVAAKAMEAAQASAAATTGTALHSLTERIDRGQDLGQVPEAFRADVAAYGAATAELEPLAIETFTVLDDLRIGGTPDRIVKYRGRAYIADVKTGSISWGAGKIAMQLAVYSRSTLYNPDGPVRTPFSEPVDQERGIVIHLPAGAGLCELHWIDLTAGWQAVELATRVRQWRARRGLLEQWPAANATDKAEAEALATISEAHSIAQLRGLYMAFVDGGLNRDLIETACQQRIAALNQAA